MKCSNIKNLIQIIILPILLFVLISPSLVQAAVAQSSAKFEFDKIDRYMKKAMRKLHIPGASLGIVRGDQIVYLKGYGSADDNNRPMTPKTPLVLGASNNCWTSLALMQLVNQGKLDLNAPIRHYIPNIKINKSNKKIFSKKITVQDLLHPVVGISIYNRFAREREDLLVRLVEAASGESYSEYLHKHIFTLLGMKNSFVSMKDAKKAGLALGHQPIFGDMVPTKQISAEGSPSHMVASSAEDLSHYLIARLNPEKFQNVVLHSKTKVQPQQELSMMGWGTQSNGAHFLDGTSVNTYFHMKLHGEYGYVLLVNSMDLLSVDAYPQMIDQIDAFIQDQKEPSLKNMPDYNLSYITVLCILLAILIMMSRTIYNLFKWLRGFKVTRSKLILHGSVILILNILIPVLMLTGIPIIVAPWPVLVVIMPGIGHALNYIPFLLLTLGLLKIIVVVRACLKWRRARMHPSST